MTGFETYKLYMAVKLHFTTDYDIFEHQARVRGWLETFEKRNDKYLFEKLGKKYDTKVMQFFVANFVYGNQWAVYSGESEEYFNTWNRRKESMTQCFKNDLCKIQDMLDIEKLSIPDLYTDDVPRLLKYYIGGKITFETMVILENYANYLPDWQSRVSLWKNHFLILQKGKRFVKYDESRTTPVYQSFLGSEL